MPAGYRKTPKKLRCRCCNKFFLSVKSAQKTCDTCLSDPVRVRELKAARVKDWVKRHPERRSEINHRNKQKNKVKYRRKQIQTNNRYMARYRVRGAEIRRQAEDRRLRTFFAGKTSDDFFAAVNGPLKKWDRKIHIKCAGQPAMFLCGRSHVFRKRWMKPAPTRNLSCKKCAAIWERLYPGVPVPVIEGDWSDEEKREWGL